MVGIISVVIGGHFGGGDHFDGGDHFGGGTGSLSYFVEIPEGWWGHQFLTNREIQGGGGVLSEIPSMLGYGYFLEPHISLYVYPLACFPLFSLLTLQSFASFLR